MKIPERLAKRPVYRGYPVPYTSIVDKDGTPDFKTTDLEKWVDVVNNGKCALCGEKLSGLKYFIGGPACNKHLAFFDPAMHKECALYAIRVCPFLAMKKDYVPLDKFRKSENLIYTEVPQANRPDFFYIFSAAGYRRLINTDYIVIPSGLLCEAIRVPDDRSDESMDAWEKTVR